MCCSNRDYKCRNEWVNQVMFKMKAILIRGKASGGKQRHFLYKPMMRDRGDRLVRPCGHNWSFHLIFPDILKCSLSISQMASLPVPWKLVSCLPTSMLWLLNCLPEENKTKPKSASSPCFSKYKLLFKFQPCCCPIIKCFFWRIAIPFENIIWFENIICLLISFILTGWSLGQGVIQR